MRSLLRVLVLFSCAAPALAQQPNFVWLISEDNSKHYLRLFDPGGAPTPHIAALARDGLRFDHAFSNAPVCSVARTTLITSCYAPRLGTQFHRRTRLAQLPKGVTMFPSLLRKAGYYATNRQKKDYNAVESPGLWDASSARASWRNRKAGQPFFHQQSFASCHEGSLHFRRRGMATQKTRTDPQSVTLPPYHPDTPTFRYTHARYRDRIALMDRQIGDVVAQLKEDGLLEETFIFYFGDHGGVLPRSKGYVYESGLHVPLVVRIPDKWKHLVDRARGSAVPGFVSFVDFGPTVLKLAGIPVPEAVDGRPFLGPGISAAEVDRRDEAFGYADRFDEKSDLVRSLRKGRFKYLRSFQPFYFDGAQNNYRYRQLAYQEWRARFRKGELNPVQSAFFRARAPEALFDLVEDPHETVNLAGHPKHQTTLHRLRQRLDSVLRTMPDLSFLPESQLVDEAMDDPVAYGAEHREQIEACIAVCDLVRGSFAEARDRLATALQSEHAAVRGWACTVCATFGKDAAPLTAAARGRMKSDPDPLVRVRAAEFLARIGAVDPAPPITAALYAARSLTEAALILNSIVVLRDGTPGFQFDIDPAKVPHQGGKNSNVRRRLDYLRR